MFGALAEFERSLKAKPNVTGFWYNAFLWTLTNDTFETVNRLTDQGLAAEYADLLTGFARNGVLERIRGSRGRDVPIERRRWTPRR